MSRVGTLKFSIKGLAEELRRRRDAERGPVVLAILLIASLLVLTYTKAPGVPPPQPVVKARIWPAKQDFGTQRVGSPSESREFLLTNNGTVSFTPKMVLTLSHANAFVVDKACGALEPQQECTIAIRFVPRAIGENSGQLFIEDENNLNLAVLDLKGTGEPTPEPVPITNPMNPGKNSGGGSAGPKIAKAGPVRLSADPLVSSFPPQQIGTNSSLRHVTLQNTSAKQFFAGYSLPSKNKGAHFRILNCDFFRYEPKGRPGDSCTIDVYSNPAAGGAHKQVVEIRELSKPGVPKNKVILARFSLENSGISSRVRVNPQLLDFSAPNLSSQGVTIQNDGDVAVKLNAAVIIGSDSNHFTANVSTCQPEPIAEKAQCVITVTHLGSQQQQVNAVLEISHAAANAPEKVQLIWKPAPLPDFSVSPPSLDLGIGVPGMPRTLQVTVTNTGLGSATSLIIRLGLQDADSFGLANDTCSGKTLVSQGQCTVTLLFTPKKQGDLNTTLFVSDGLLKGLRGFPVTGQYPYQVGFYSP